MDDSIREKMTSIDTEEKLEEHLREVNYSIRLQLDDSDDRRITVVPDEYINKIFILSSSSFSMLDVIEESGLFRYKDKIKTKCGKIFLLYYDWPEELENNVKIYTDGEMMDIDETGLMFIYEKITKSVNPPVNADNTKPN
jgi:hypothetical protein